MAGLRRRFASLADVRFPILAIEAPVATMREHVLALSRRQFSAFEQDGAFALTWIDHGTRTGLARSALPPADRDVTLVLSGPPALAIDARRLASRVSVVAVGGELDRARAPLSQRACLQRLVGRKIRDRLDSRMAATEPQAEISLARDLGGTLEQLAAAILQPQA